MKKIGTLLSLLGILLIAIFALLDYIEPGNGVKLGSAQLLGIESGIGFVLLGAGLLLTSRNREIQVGNSLRLGIAHILNLSPVVWGILTFLALYALFFVFPMFFLNTKVQYFVKYIPDAWVTRIGFDLGTTMDHIQGWLVDNVSPYADGVVPYSPLTLAVFAPLLILGYPGYYKALTLMTLAVYLFATLWIPARMDPRKQYALISVFSLLGLFSYGFQFELERGQFNVLAYALCLLAIYIYHYHHAFRYFAYLSFCLAVQLKLYPLIFIFMFIKDWKDWKGNIRRWLGLGLLNFALLFVLGYRFGMEFITSIAARQLHFQSSRIEDLSISGFVYSLTTKGMDSNGAGGLMPYGRALELLFLLVFGTCLVALLAHLYMHNRVGLNPYLLAVCTIGALIIPAGSFDYKLPLLVAPVALIFCSLPVMSDTRKKVASIILIVAMSSAYWSTLYPATVKPVFLARNFPALFVMLISITGLYFLVNERTEPKAIDVSNSRPLNNS